MTADGPRWIVQPPAAGELTLDLDNGTPTVARPELLFGEHYPSGLLLPEATLPRRPSGRR